MPADIEPDHPYCDVEREVGALPAYGLARVDEWLDRRSLTPTIYGETQGKEAILSLGCGVGVVPGLVLEKSALRDRACWPSMSDGRVTSLKVTTSGAGDASAA